MTGRGHSQRAVRKAEARPPAVHSTVASSCQPVRGSSTTHGAQSDGLAPTSRTYAKGTGTDLAKWRGWSSYALALDLTNEQRR